MGKDAPSEIIIAVISSSVSFAFFPTFIPLFHRLSRRAQRRVLLALAAGTVGMVVFFAGPWWSTYDAMHPKRSAMQYTYNHTTGEHTAHLAFMDKGTKLGFVEAIHERYGSGPVERTSLGEYDPDWDVLYPVSSFLDTYRFRLPSTPFDWPNLQYTAHETESNEARRIQLSFNFTGIIWPVLAFEAEILDWSFDFDPPNGRKRHHIKIATSIDATEVDLELAVRNEGPLSIQWSAIDLNQMVPGTASTMGPDMPASKMLMDLDAWGTEKWDDSLDFLLYGVVAGVIEV